MSSSDDVDNVTELVYFNGYRSNDVEHEMLSTVKKLDGCLRVYNGAELTNKESGIWIQDWKSLGHHAAFQRSDIYPSFVARVPGFAESLAKMTHVCFHPYPADPVLRMPVTAIITLLMNHETPTEEAESVLKVLEDVLASCQDGVALVRGRSLENDREFVIACGWKSEDEYEDFKGKNASTFTTLAKFGELSTKLYKLEL